MFLAGDIGGTKTVLALLSSERDLREPMAELLFRSRDYDRLEDIVTRFLNEVEVHLATESIAGAAFGVAGPVIDDEAKVTNLNWTVARNAVAEQLNLADHRVRLLNDLEATANGVPQLLPSDIYTLNAGAPLAHATMAVIAPGTGLGQAFLTWDGDGYRPHPSEGGHVDFAPCDQLQLELLNYLYRQYDHVSFERVVSGQGIPSIYRFLRDTGRAEEPDALASQLEQADDQTPVIMSHAEKFAICQQTLEVFVAILGAKAGNVALSLMACGGVYLGGGIPPRIVPRLHSQNFLQPFTSKGRFSGMMAKIPVHVITNAKTALIGASHAALSLG